LVPSRLDPNRRRGRPARATPHPDGDAAAASEGLYSAAGSAPILSSSVGAVAAVVSAALSPRAFAACVPAARGITACACAANGITARASAANRITPDASPAFGLETGNSAACRQPAGLAVGSAAVGAQRSCGENARKSAIGNSPCTLEPKARRFGNAAQWRY
jgi:hypothetical protein